MRAVVMAGGRGERLRPLTDTCPKPLLPVAGRPVLDRLLEKLAEAGIQDVTLAVGYLGSMIEDYVGDGARWGVAADYVRQVEPMGTAGALSLLDDKGLPALIINGDKVVESAKDLRNIIEFGVRWNSSVVGTHDLTIAHGVAWSGNHWVFEEKPTLNVFAGIYWLRARVIQSVAERCGMMDVIQSAQPKEFTVLRCLGYVLDIGTPATYEAACARLS